MKEMNALEKEFDAAYETAQKEIKTHLNAAQACLNQAIEVAEKYGVPFSSHINESRGNAYIPKSLKEKWKYLDREFLFEYVYSEYGYDYGGWTHSSVGC